ncbi:MAG: hypothetical protein FWG90_03975 [Oscillospiraceae bacterium]|nr:hypothetical protein [Oscillospiraceae bacterium]
MRKCRVAAVIDIGSSVVRMHVSQWDGEKITELDMLEKPTQMGKEVFSSGVISSDTARSLSGVLNGFCEKAREYGITSVHAIATTALREAVNQAYILDYISTRNKLEVKVLEDNEVGTLLTGALKAGDKARAPETLYVYGGMGATDFELLKAGGAALTHSLQTGLLKISEMLHEASDFSRHTDCMAEEYLHTVLSKGNRMRDLLKAKRVVFGVGDLQPIYKLLKLKSDSGEVEIDRKAMLEIYESHRSLSEAQICRKHRLNAQQGENLYSMITLLAVILRATNADKLVCVRVNLAGAMLDTILQPDARKKHIERLHNGAVSSALDLALRYGCDEKHCEYVSKAALMLFKELRKVFGFTKMQSLLLHIACILHEAGHYVNSDNAQEAAFYLVKSAHIHGLCSRETMLAASIIAPQSLPGITPDAAVRAGMLCSDDALVAAKMHAIARLADAFDFSHMQKAKIIDITHDDDSLVISVQILKDYTLEQWAFNHRAELFRDIFGITPKLKVDNIYVINN